MCSSVYHFLDYPCAPAFSLIDLTYFSLFTIFFTSRHLVTPHIDGRINLNQNGDFQSTVQHRCTKRHLVDRYLISFEPMQLGCCVKGAVSGKWMTYRDFTIIEPSWVLMYGHFHYVDIKNQKWKTVKCLVWGNCYAALIHTFPERLSCLLQFDRPFSSAVVMTS